MTEFLRMALYINILHMTRVFSSLLLFDPSWVCSILSLCPFLNVRDHVSHPRKITRVIQKIKTASARALLADFAWDVLFCPPYTVDLAPNDFHLFTHLKQCLGGTRMGDYEEVKKTVKDCFSRVAADVYDTIARIFMGIM
jgi:hypothetical protein